MSDQDVVITGIGIVSCLGVGRQAHWDALTADSPAPVVDAERFSPYSVHPLPEIDWSAQIPRRGDQRQMETWQRLGTYAAGLALDDAAIKGDEALCATMDMIVAAGGGERDLAVDTAILDASLTRNDQDLLLNEKLTTELRPTLFLAQLSNLLAGNISIVHKVTGSSRTFMGEEGAGVSALETAVARIRAGQSSHLLVGGAFQSEHPDYLLSYELDGLLHRGDWAPVWARGERGGIITGSGAAFLVLETRAHAQERGRKAYAMIGRIVSEGSSRAPETFPDRIGALIETASNGVTPAFAMSGASGAAAATVAEKTALDKRGLAARGFSSLTGHLKEAQFPFAVALAALAVEKNHALAPFDAGCETAAAAVGAVVATTIGYRRGEGAALIEPA
ncbi:beta-ketoacyl-ACP synthase [Nitratireductor sp. CAU 1489]|uniref:Beta-ketoacyl-ACP synthase n=1 Tax=Nitratireductor arenosus TaxID=2682096 RepID=A0A844QBC6_9HYPH|nr:beta-ketoacyl-ACP synthase [Nitratireductor arenosus]MVA97326.1 beta-ketoacyl-ACP synthase [Nitratireductor arenosus]